MQDWTDDAASRMVSGFILGGIMTSVARVGPRCSTVFPLNSPSSGAPYLIRACQWIDNWLVMLVT